MTPPYPNDGSLQLPPGAAIDHQPDTALPITRRPAGVGDLVRVHQNAPLWAVRYTNQITRKYLPPEELVPVAASLAGADEIAGTAAAAGYATLVGSWLEPTFPEAWFSMYAITPHARTGSRHPPLAWPPGTHEYLAVRIADADLACDDEPQPALAFQADHGPLFAAAPALTDIQQGGLGSCSYLSAVAAIMRVDPGFPARIMCALPGGDVVVRLFDADRRQDGVHWTPHYVRVQRSTVIDADGDPAFAQGALWVRILEKAYVAAGYVASDKGSTTLRAYGNVESVAVDVALGHLLGLSATTIPVWPLAKLPAASTGPVQPAPKDRYPVRGTAYAASETELYDRIAAALGANRAVVAQTWASITNKPAPVGLNPGEQVRHGLVGAHGYAVMGVKPPGPDGRRMVSLRNPWGFYGVQYELDPSTGLIKRREDTAYPPTGPRPNPPQGFDLDVRDLVRRFEKVTITDQPVPTP